MILEVRLHDFDTSACACIVVEFIKFCKANGAIFVLVVLFNDAFDSVVLFWTR